jgi:hypothetical protein
VKYACCCCGNAVTGMALCCADCSVLAERERIPLSAVARLRRIEWHGASAQAQAVGLGLTDGEAKP